MNVQLEVRHGKDMVNFPLGKPNFTWVSFLSFCGSSFSARYSPTTESFSLTLLVTLSLELYPRFSVTVLISVCASSSGVIVLPVL